MPGPHRLFTFDLGRVGDRATLVLTEKIAKKPPAKGAAWDWKCNEAQRFAGTVAERGNQLVFRLAESSQPSELRDMTCTLRSVRVAAANATRVSVPSKMEGCNAHRWSPATAVTQRALECKAEWLPYWARDAFAAPVPGLEHLTVDEDDCGDPTQALRLIRANGEVAPVFRD